VLYHLGKWKISFKISSSLFKTHLQQLRCYIQWFCHDHTSRFKKLRRIFYLICNSLHVIWISHTTFLMHQQNLISNIIENMR